MKIGDSSGMRLGLQAVRGRVLELEGAMETGVPVTCQEVLDWGTIDAANRNQKY